MNLLRMTFSRMLRELPVNIYASKDWIGERVMSARSPTALVRIVWSALALPPGGPGDREGWSCPFGSLEGVLSEFTVEVPLDGAPIYPHLRGDLPLRPPQLGQNDDCVLFRHCENVCHA